MAVVVDVIFTVILALTGPDSNEVQKASFAFDTRAACMSFRGERIDYAADRLKSDPATKGYTFYISECDAVKVTKVNPAD